jgi:uncharacterized protein
MFIPTTDQCLSIMRKNGMPPHIQRHSLVVANIALVVGGQLHARGIQLDLNLLVAGGLLHDIAKAHCLNTGQNHAMVGGTMVREMGYPMLEPIVAEHIRIHPEDLEFPLSESLLVNYADKRVKHDQVVSLEERFRDLADRYGHTQERKSRLQENLDLYLRLENRIFQDLDLRPLDMLPLAADLELHSNPR